MTKKQKPSSFEDAFIRLEQIVQELEDGKLSLEDNLKLFEEGIELSENCRAELQQAENRIKTLVKQADDSFNLEDMD